MLIEYDLEKINGFKKVIEDHDFEVFLGFTKKFKAYEALNLQHDIKNSLLTRLSTANYRQAPSFQHLWKWFKEKHGMEIAKQFCEHLYPSHEGERQKTINKMRNNQQYDLWNHIKARVYKKWCSILTEMQCVYSIVEGVENAGLDWKIVASAELDAYGIDFAIVSNNSVYPIQIKKDSFNTYTHIKGNFKENFSRFEITKAAKNILEKELKKNGLKVTIGLGLLIKYGLPKKGKFDYQYLGRHKNGFVYFKKEKIITEIFDFIEYGKA